MQPLHITDFGVFLGKHSERLVVRKGKEVLSEHPLALIEQVLVTGRGVSFSSDLIEECCERGIPVTLLSPAGKPYARVAGTVLNATVRTRREQLAAYQDGRGAGIARAIAAGKVQNQGNLLRYFGKYSRKARPELHALLTERAGRIVGLARELAALPEPTADALRPGLLNREGRAGALYWEGVAALLKGRVEFAGRTHRGADDPVNAALNYGYGILQSQVWSAASLAGLDAHGGFIHVDRPGRPSLVLDLMEEFRQPVVDRALLAAWGRGWKAEMETVGEEPELLLTREARREIAARIFERMDTATPHEGKKQTLRNVLQMQARRLAVAVRGEAEYAAYVSGW